MPEAVKKPSAKKKTASKAKTTAAKRRPAAAKPAHKKAPAKKTATPRKPDTLKKTTSGKGLTRKSPAKKTAAKKAPAGKRTASAPAKKASAGKRAGSAPAKKVTLSPVAHEANRRHAAPGAKGNRPDLFMEKKPSPKRKKGGGKRPPKGNPAAFGAVNVALMLGIALLIILGVRQQAAYAEFMKMRAAVDQQTFYEGTTVEGVDVSNMTLSDAVAYWRDRVEARNENRAVVFDDGTTVTAKELGYSSDYESVLSAAWSAGRSGSLEERYRHVSDRVSNPVAYRITRSDYSAAAMDACLDQLAGQINRPVREASIRSFNTETYEFEFDEAEAGRELDRDALKASIAESLAQGGGNVSLPVKVIEPETTTEEVSARYGLIDYAITNASSSSKSRLNNIKVALSYINGTRLAPGEEFSFNKVVGERTASRGFKMATAYSGGEVTEQLGGGICQVSTTLFNAAVKADMEIVERHNHSLTVHYVDKGKDATVDWGHQDFRFKNNSDDDVYICCYLTEDKRVRFGIFGKLLPNGEKITLEATTTEVVKAETEYQPSAFLAKGQTYLLQEGRNGYKAEAYKVRWDAAGNELSRELLCKSVYKVKNEIIQYGT